MSAEPTQRQVLYALVSAGFLLVVLALTIGAAVAGLVPVPWTVAMLVATVGSGIWGGFNWTRTGPLLVVSISLFVVWTVGTLTVA
ncbi:MAG: hypothetical protein ACFCU2_11235 [Acidimicrobiia bacterium]